MNLNSYFNQYSDEVANALAFADEKTREISHKILCASAASWQLIALNMLNDALSQITAESEGRVSLESTLSGNGVVDFILASQRIEVVSEDPGIAGIDTPEYGTENDARLTLRLPQNLKETLESNAQSLSVSLNSYLVNELKRVASANATGSASAQQTNYRSETYNGFTHVKGWA